MLRALHLDVEVATVLGVGEDVEGRLAHFGQLAMLFFLELESERPDSAVIFQMEDAVQELPECVFVVKECAEGGLKLRVKIRFAREISEMLFAWKIPTIKKVARGECSESGFIACWLVGFVLRASGWSYPLGLFTPQEGTASPLCDIRYAISVVRTGFGFPGRNLQLC